MERLKRYEKQIVALMSALVVLVGGVLSTSFQSRASSMNFGTEYYVNYAEPATSEYEGYITCLFRNSSGSYNVKTFFWYCAAVLEDALPCSMYIRLNSSYIEFAPASLTNTSGVVGVYTLGWYDTAGVCTWVKTSTSERYRDTFYGNTCIAFKYSGNVYQVDYDDTVPNNSAWTVYFASDGSARLLQSVINLLMTSNNVNIEIRERVNSILSSVDGVENQLNKITDYLKDIDDELTSIRSELENIYDKADEILQEEKKQTTWLEKIWNSLQEFLGLEGEESTEDLEGKEESAELEKQEDELLNDDSVNTGDLELELDTNTSGTIWAMVDNLVTSHEKLFTTLISILTLGIVALILNR